MPNIDIIINSFQTGELNPLLFGRTETEFFQRSCRSLENMFIHVEGPAQKRGGTKYIAPANNESNPVRLIPFEFSREDAFVLEFGHLYVRVLARDGIVVDSGGNDVVLTTPYTGAQVTDVQYVQSADVLFLAHPSHAPRQLVRSLDSSGNVVWTFETYDYVDGPYLDENTNEAHTLQISHTTGTSRTVTAAGSGNTPFVSTDVGRYIRIFVSNQWGTARITGFSSSTSVTVDVTNDFGGTTASDRWQLGAWSASTGWPAAVTIYERRLVWGFTTTSPQTFWTTITNDFYTFTPTEDNGSLAADNGLALTLGGSKVSLIRWLVGAQNLVIGTSGGVYRTDTTNGAPISASTARVLYDNGVECSDVQPVQIGTNVLFLQKQRRKFFSIRYDFTIDGLNDTNISQYAEHLLLEGVKEFSIQKEPNALFWAVLDDGGLACCTYEPRNNVLAWGPHTIGGTFRGGSAVVESLATIAGDGQDNVWVCVRRTINGTERRYIERIVEDEDTDQQFAWYLDCASQEDIPATISNITQSGSVVTVTTTAAHGYTVGQRVCFYDIVGTSELNLTRHNIVSVPTTTTFTFTEATTLNAYIEGGTVRRFFSTITGLTHLEGETLAVLADGAAQPDVTVSSGSVTLQAPGAIVLLGYRYRALLSPRPYVAAGVGIGGQVQNRKKRNVKSFIKLHRTLGLQYGTDLDNLVIFPFRTTDDRMDTAIPLFTGGVEITIPSSYLFDEPFYLVNDQPFPFTLLSLAAQIDVAR